MGNGGGLEGQDRLGQVEVRVLQFLHGPDLIHGQKGKQGQEPGHVAVIRVDPVLVIVIGRGALGIQPDSPLGGLAHLGAAGSGNQREGNPESRALVDPPDQVDAGHNVAPLIAAAHLQAAVVVFIEFQKVVRLQQHVIEFDETEAVVGVEPHLVALGLDHPVHREMAADVP